MTTAASTSRSASIGQYFFVIENLPRRYTWQDLKDLIRKEASHGVWAEMAFYPNGQTGGKGHARIKRQDEARNLYQYLTTSIIEGRRLQVHLWDIGGTTAQFLHCNCESPTAHSTRANSTQSADISRIALAPGWQMVSVPQAPQAVMTPVQYPAPAAGYSSPPAPQPPMNQAQLISAMANMGLTQQDPRFYEYASAYAAQYAQPLSAQASQAQAGPSRSSAVYTTNISSLPVNVRNGTVRTEVRGVFVSGLSYQASRKEIEALFGTAGEISKCEVQKDAATGRSKGRATIKYTTAAGAAQAISTLDGRTWYGMKLKVRADTETTPVSAPPVAEASRTSQPVIVNGSQVRPPISFAKGIQADDLAQPDMLRRDSARQE